MKWSGLTIRRRTILAVAWALLLVPVFVLITACQATYDQFPERKRDVIFAKIFVVDEIPGAASDVLGQAKWDGARCTVYVRSDIYPYAMTHELMHCFSGNWHEGSKSAEYQHIVD